MCTAPAFKIGQPDPFFTAQRVEVGNEGGRIGVNRSPPQFGSDFLY